MSKEEDDRKRDASIHFSTPGHWWSGYGERNRSQDVEIDPGTLNLNDIQDFLKFLAAINRGEKKSINFLSRMPAKRISQLKATHEALGAQLLALGE